MRHVLKWRLYARKVSALLLALVFVFALPVTARANNPPPANQEVSYYLLLTLIRDMLKETSFAIETAIDLSNAQRAVMIPFFQAAMPGVPLDNVDFGQTPAILLSSRPLIDVETVEEHEGFVSILNERLVFEVGTVLSFSYLRDFDGQFAPNITDTFAPTSYWGNRLDYEMILILDDSLMSNSVSATRIRYGQEVTLTADMVGRRLGIGFFGEMLVMGGGASESMFELKVVPEGTFATTPLEGVSLVGPTGTLSTELPILERRGQAYVPFQEVVQNLGGTVQWDIQYGRSDRIVTGTLNGNSLSVSLDLFWLVHNNNDFATVFAPGYVPFLHEGILYVPIRYFHMAFNMGLTTTAGHGAAVIPQAPITPIPTPSPTPAPATETTWSRNSSEITLPNRRLNNAEMQAWIDEYDANGGASNFELEVIRLINEIRRDHGLVELNLDPILSMSTRFYAQTLDNLNLPLGHREGPYGGSAGTVEAFGGRWNTANATTASSTPQAAVTSWMNSPGHRDNILNPSSRYIGIGQFGIFVYMQSHSASNTQTRRAR